MVAVQFYHHERQICEITYRFSDFGIHIARCRLSLLVRSSNFIRYKLLYIRYKLLFIMWVAGAEYATAACMLWIATHCLPHPFILITRSVALAQATKGGRIYRWGVIRIFTGVPCSTNHLSFVQHAHSCLYKVHEHSSLLFDSLRTKYERENVPFDIAIIILLVINTLLVIVWQAWQTVATATSHILI